MPQAGSRPRPLPELSTTVVELWASPDLQEPPGTQLHTFWNQLETTQNHRKRANLTGTDLKQKVVPGLFQSSQATVLELWASLDLTRRAFTCCFSYNAQRVIRKRKNDDLYEFAVI